MPFKIVPIKKVHTNINYVDVVRNYACEKLVSPKNLGSTTHLGTIQTLFISLKVLALYTTKHVFVITI
jgi:hypothetical protein